MSDNEQTRAESPKFDFSAFPEDTLFYDRRDALARGERRAQQPAVPPVEKVNVVRPERRARKERRRRVDPTTFEKQYTEDEIEFMNAIQHFKTQSGKPFPSYGEVLRIAARLGYRKGFPVDDDFDEEETLSREVEAILPL
jgi:hypothetical protein